MTSEGTAGTVHQTVEFHRATSGELLLRIETESDLRDFGIVPYHNREIVWARFPRKVPET